jgi:hypothetical protein
MSENGDNRAFFEYFQATFPNVDVMTVPSKTRKRIVEYLSKDHEYLKLYEITSKGIIRLRSPRTITLDESIELSSNHIKAMLRDTSDIVLQYQSPSVDAVALSSNEKDDVSALFSIHARQRRRLQQRMGRQDHSSHRGDPENVSILSYDILLTRPNIADSGMLAPELLNLWAMNAARLFGKDRLPFRMRADASADYHPSRVRYFRLLFFQTV